MGGSDASVSQIDAQTASLVLRLLWPEETQRQKFLENLPKLTNLGHALMNDQAQSAEAILRTFSPDQMDSLRKNVVSALNELVISAPNAGCGSSCSRNAVISRPEVATEWTKFSPPTGRVCPETECAASSGFAPILSNPFAESSSDCQPKPVETEPLVQPPGVCSAVSTDSSNGSESVEDEISIAQPLASLPVQRVLAPYTTVRDLIEAWETKTETMLLGDKVSFLSVTFQRTKPQTYRTVCTKTLDQVSLFSKEPGNAPSEPWNAVVFEEPALNCFGESAVVPSYKFRRILAGLSRVKPSACVCVQRRSQTGSTNIRLMSLDLKSVQFHLPSEIPRICWYETELNVSDAISAIDSEESSPEAILKTVSEKTSAPVDLFRVKSPNPEWLDCTQYAKRFPEIFSMPNWQNLFHVYRNSSCSVWIPKMSDEVLEARFCFSTHAAFAKSFENK